MDDGIYSMIKDKKWNVSFNIEWLKSLNNITIIEKQEFSTLPPEKRLEALQMLLQSKQKSLEILKGKIDEKHDSLLNDINEQIRYYRQELELIDRELKTEKNSVKKFFKNWEKGRMEKKSAKLE